MANKDLTIGFETNDLTAGFDMGSVELDKSYGSNILEMQEEIPQISINEIVDNYNSLVADPKDLPKSRLWKPADEKKKPADYGNPQLVSAEPTTSWGKIKRFFTGDRLPLSPDASRIEKFDRVFDTAIGTPLRVFLKTVQGKTFNAPDFMWVGLKRIIPDDAWDDEVKKMTLDEAMDWAAGYNPSGFAKMAGEIGEFSGRLSNIRNIAGKTIGPKAVDRIIRGGVLFGGASATEQIGKLGLTKVDPTEADYGYEGATAVLRDFVIGAVFSAIGLGVKAVWAKLTPTEQVRALKVLGLKKGATLDEINQAARELSRKYHPDKVKGMKEAFQEVIKARDVLRQGESADIVFRGVKTTWTAPKQLPGQVTIKEGVVKSTKKLAQETRMAYNKKKTLLELAISDNQIDDIMSIQDYPQKLANVGRRSLAWLYTFGDAKQKSPELFDKAMEAYGKRNAGLEKALSQVEGILKAEEPFEESVGVKLSFSYEDKRIAVPEGYEETFGKFNELFTQIEEKSKTSGIISRSFKERMLEGIDTDIEKLEFELKHPRKSKRYKQLLKEREDIENMSYLPHTKVAQVVAQSKYNSLPGRERQAFRDKMTAFFNKRKGKLFLKDYLELGLVEESDIDIRKLATQTLYDYYRRDSLKSLFDYAIDQGFVLPHDKKLREAGWLNQSEVGITSKELKERLIHPAFGLVLDEMKRLRYRKGGPLRKLLGMTKIAHFVNPSILWIYNIAQKYFRGMWSFNPTKEVKFTNEAIRNVIQKTPLYHKVNEGNLFQFPYEINRHSVDAEIGMLINKYSPHIPSIVKSYEKITGKPWPKNGAQVLESIITSGHTAIGQITWNGDKVQRMQSYLALKDMGYSDKEAIAVSSKGHGAYSLLSPKVKQKLQDFLFVYAFRFLMPVEMGKAMFEPMKGLYDKFAKGNDIPKHKWERWVKSIIGTVMVPVMVDQYWKMRGYKQEGKALGPLAWKYKKEIYDNEGNKTELVVGMNYILNMPIKYWNRLTYTNPITPEPGWQEVMENALKWEVHPLWRILFWDIRENRRSLGTGLHVWDPQEQSTIKQFTETSKYVFGQLFRFWGGVMDARSDGTMTYTEEQKQLEIFRKGMNAFDRVLTSTIGNAYIRLPLEQRRMIMLKRLENEVSRRSFEIKRRYQKEPDELERRMKSLEQWHNTSLNWIKEMK